MDNNSFKIVTICGSNIFETEINETARKLNEEGYIVLMLHASKSNMNLVRGKKMDNRSNEMYYQMIDMSEILIIFNKDGYIDANTMENIEYAKNQGKQILYSYVQCNENCKSLINGKCSLLKKLPAVNLKHYCGRAKYPICLLYRQENKAQL